MKKRIILAVSLLAVMLSACGKKVEEIEQTRDVSNIRHDENVKTLADYNQKSLYPDTEEFVWLDMGAEYKGEQKKICKVMFPVTYSFSGSFSRSDESGSGAMIQGDLSDLIANGEVREDGSIPAAGNAMYQAAATSHSLDNTFISVEVITSDISTFKEAKKSLPDGVDFGTKAHPAYWCSPEEGSTGMTMLYSVDGATYIHITYRSGLTQLLEKETLAWALYDLIELAE